MNILYMCAYINIVYIPFCRYSGDFTDSFGHLQTTKLGINNNGYIPYVDYNRDYTPPPSLTLNHVKPTYTSSSLSNHLIIGTSTTTPTITSASIVGISTGTITNGTYSLTRNRPLDRLLENGLPSGNATLPHNGLISEFCEIPKTLILNIVCFFFLHHLDQSLLNIDPRYSATYGNPYLRQQHSPLIITSNNTANPALTPAPPPYMSASRGSNSNSSFSSSTTISNVNGGGSILGIGTTLASNSIQSSQTPSPSSGQFIVPANSKVGGLATHV